MSKPKLTPWFPPEVKPVHVGVYEIDTRFGVRFSHWDGKTWGYFTPISADRALEKNDHRHGAMYSWRGLTEKST